MKKTPTPSPKTLKLRVQKPRQPSEADIQRAVMRRLQLDGWMVVRVNSGARKTESGAFFRAYIIQGLFGEKGAPVSSGFPDVLAIRGDVQGGRLLLLEIKDARGKSSESQLRFREFAARFGMNIYIVRHPDELAQVYEKELP